MRRFTINRWNWSDRAEKWVYVAKKNGRRVYTYQLEPPPEFTKLTNQIVKLNDKLLTIKDPEENEKLYKELMNLSKRMQEMGR